MTDIRPKSKGLMAEINDIDPRRAKRVGIGLLVLLAISFASVALQPLFKERDGSSTTTIASTPAPPAVDWMVAPGPIAAQPKPDIPPPPSATGVEADRRAAAAAARKDAEKTEAQWKAGKADKAKGEAKTYAACLSMLEKAKKADLYYGVRTVDGLPQVLVGPTWFRVGIDVKEGFANTVNCVMTKGKNEPCEHFNIADWRNGEPIGRYNALMCKLELKK